jgi:hypothetical protein
MREMLAPFISEPVEAAVLDRFLDNAVKVPAPVLECTLQTCISTSFADRVESLQMPVLVVGGRRDAFFPQGRWLSSHEACLARAGSRSRATTRSPWSNRASWRTLSRRSSLDSASDAARSRDSPRARRDRPRFGARWVFLACLSTSSFCHILANRRTSRSGRNISFVPLTRKWRNGRRTSLRGWRSQERRGSNPLFRTSSEKGPILLGLFRSRHRKANVGGPSSFPSSNS